MLGKKQVKTGGNFVSEAKSQLLNEKITRREFLKYSGITTIGAATLTWLLPGCKAKDIVVFEAADGVIIHEAPRCTGCLVCEATCSVGNDGKASQLTARVKVSKNFALGPGKWDGDLVNGPGEYRNFTMTADTCRQCESPACALACPQGAIFQQAETGARQIDKNLCVGCGTCTEACPWGIPTVDPETQKSTKCLLCHGYTACVKDCPTGALHYVTWADALVKYKEHFEV